MKGTIVKIVSVAFGTNQIKARIDKTKQIANVGYVVIETKPSIT